MDLGKFIKYLFFGKLVIEIKITDESRQGLLRMLPKLRLSDAFTDKNSKFNYNEFNHVE